MAKEAPGLTLEVGVVRWLGHRIRRVPAETNKAGDKY